MRAFKWSWIAALLFVPPLTAGTGDVVLIDASGLEWFINTDITFATTSSASGAASEASYTNAVAATTSMGGTSMTTLSDAFDGYNSIEVNGTSYNMNGVANLDCNGRQVLFNAQMIGNVVVSRKVFVPDNDEFARWLNVFTNSGMATEHVVMLTANNLGSDSNTEIFDSSDGTLTAETTDLWVATFEAFSGGSSGDPRLAHVLQGPGAPIMVNQINFTDGDDEPFWGYEFDLPPGATFIFMNFAVGQPSQAAAAAKADELTELPDNALQCLTSAELNGIKNFATGDCDGDGVNDANQIAADPSLDANGNGIVDACDIADGTSEDCDANGIPDEAETDTDGDGIIDACDNCPLDANADQADADSDGVGNACEVVANQNANVNNNANNNANNNINDNVNDNGVDNGGMPMACGPVCGGAGMALMPLMLAAYAGLLVSRRRR